MDMYRTFLAIALSFVILLGYQYFFAPPVQEPQPPATSSGQGTVASSPDATVNGAPTTVSSTATEVAVDPAARDITVETPLYTAVVSEQGGAIKSFLLKQHRTGISKDSGAMELAPASNPADRPLLFSLDNGANTELPLYKAANTDTQLKAQQGQTELVMTATMPEGVQVVRTMRFSADSYLIPVQYTLKNTTDRPLQVSPALIWNSAPFPHTNPPSSYLFAGPAAYINNELVEIKGKELGKGPVIKQGTVSWAGYTDSYFITTVMPETEAPLTLTVQGSDAASRSILSQGLETLQPNSSTSYDYTLYMGPKKFTTLQNLGHNLAHAVDYGWLDLIAKPMLWLLNFFYSFTKNYGIAIILLVTDRLGASQQV